MGDRQQLVFRSKVESITLGEVLDKWAGSIAKIAHEGNRRLGLVTGDRDAPFELCDSVYRAEMIRAVRGE